MNKVRDNLGFMPIEKTDDRRLVMLRDKKPVDVEMVKKDLLAKIADLEKRVKALEVKDAKPSKRKAPKDDQQPSAKRARKDKQGEDKTASASAAIEKERKKSKKAKKLDKST